MAACRVWSSSSREDKGDPPADSGERVQLEQSSFSRPTFMCVSIVCFWAHLYNELSLKLFWFLLGVNGVRLPKPLTVNRGDFPPFRWSRISIQLPQLSTACSPDSDGGGLTPLKLPSAELTPPVVCAGKERRKNDGGSIIVISLRHYLLQVIAFPDRSSLGAAADCGI